MKPDHICPHLGLNGDPDTWVTEPAPHHACHRSGTPCSIAEAHQVMCLSSEHKACPVFRGHRDAPPPGEPLTSEPQRKAPMWLLAPVLLLCVVGALGVWASLSRLGQAEAQPVVMATTSTLPTQQPASQATTISSTAQPPTPTPIVIASASEPASAASPTLTASIQRSSYLRQAASANAEVIVLIDTPQQVDLVGRDTFGNWVVARSSTGVTGWLAASQLADGVDVLRLPIVRTTFEQASSGAGGETFTTGQEEAAAGPTQQIPLPDTFSITLTHERVSSCGPERVEYEYRFDINGQSLIVERTIDRGMFTGWFLPSSGRFGIYYHHSVLTEYMEGDIQQSDGAIVVSGTHQIDYHQHDCFSRLTYQGSAPSY